MDAESTHWPATVSSSTPSQPIITEAFRARKNSQNSLSRQQAPNISIEEPPMLKVIYYQKEFSSSQLIQIENTFFSFTRRYHTIHKIKVVK